MENKIQILLIDDDEMFRSMMRISLELEGWLVDTAVNGSIGVEKCREKKYDLVITDLIMPEKEGLETIQQLRASYPDLPLFCVSGGGLHYPEDILSIARLMGADEAFSKPVKRDLLIEAIHARLNRKLN